MSRKSSVDHDFVAVDVSQYGAETQALLTKGQEETRKHTVKENWTQFLESAYTQHDNVRTYISIFLLLMNTINFLYTCMYFDEFVEYWVKFFDWVVGMWICIEFYTTWVRSRERFNDYMEDKWNQGDAVAVACSSFSLLFYLFYLPYHYPVFFGFICIIMLAARAGRGFILVRYLYSSVPKVAQDDLPRIYDFLEPYLVRFGWVKDVSEFSPSESELAA